MLSNNAVNSKLLVRVLAVCGLMFALQAQADCDLVSNKDGSKLPIKVSDTDTPEAKEFLKTCVNPYSKKYLADPEAAKAGKKLFNYNNCSGCHGGNLEGVMAPALHKAGGNDIYDGKWTYAKNKTDKGIFETIAGGGANTSVSNRGVMLTFHKDVPGHLDAGLSTDEILKIVGFIRTKYRGDDEKTWLK